MRKECGARLSRRLLGGSNTSSLKMTAWEATSYRAIFLFALYPTWELVLRLIRRGFRFFLFGFRCLNCVRENKFDESSDEDVDVSTNDNSSQGQQDEVGTSTNLLFGVRSRYGRTVRFNNRLLYDPVLKSDSSTFVLPHCTE